MAITDFRGEYRWLSNFHEIDIEYQGHVYPSTEHAYQAAKTVNLEEREKVRIAKTPGKARRLGQKVTMMSAWGLVRRTQTMRSLIRKKFQDLGLRAKLLATERQHLVEGNTWGDKFWGVCEGEGLNHLGRILMDIREEVREDTPALEQLAMTAEALGSIPAPMSISPATFKWARDSLLFDVQKFYDDPFGVCDSMNEIREHSQELRQIAKDLGVDYEEAVLAESTEFERKRIAKILAFVEKR